MVRISCQRIFLKRLWWCYLVVSDFWQLFYIVRLSRIGIFLYFLTLVNMFLILVNIIFNLRMLNLTGALFFGTMIFLSIGS